MLTKEELIERERSEEMAMWELFSHLLDLNPDFCFTAKEIAKALDYDKKFVSRMLYRLTLQKAVVMHGKKWSKSTVYQLNPLFLKSS